MFTSTATMVALPTVSCENLMTIEKHMPVNKERTECPSRMETNEIEQPTPFRC